MTSRFLFVALLMLSAQVRADDHPLTLWLVEGAANRVYLLGSVHLLRQSDYPLPSRIDAAYEDADKLVMELDMDDLDPVATQSLVSSLGMLPEGSSLADLVGSEVYSQAQELAAGLDLPLHLLSSVEPWLAAITIEQLALTRIGFNPAFGVESHLAGKAGSDGKDILGLERIEEQLSFLDTLSLDAQRALLLQTLVDSAELESTMDELIDAWRNGRIDELEDAMLNDMLEFPELYQALVVSRNRAWTERIEALLGERTDYLVVVGALHLIGDDGLPALLQRRGFAPVQLHNE
ncbi:MAG: TraB/GumN family protein [Gammaproteobacteria bacterium]|nr:TraB/GumN family protein [Gammaproteobacteria bacterium]MDH4253258.1 TraB/GumN family protein [Gammaproteobacteria bacterium]MDH5308963.1 TraB/GumN family protein [Gammaproteobacteria bacterium]